MIRLILSAIIISTFLFLSNLPVLAFSGIDGQLIKTADSSAVYLVKNNVRYAFSDQKTYESWHGNDFSQVQTISFEVLSGYRIVGLVTYKPKSLIKIQSDPKVYEVLDNDGSISWVSSEQEAINKFGSSWASLVRDVPASFFVNYTIVGDTGAGVTLDTGDTPSQCSFELTPAQPEKEINLVRITNNNIGDDDPDIAWSGTNYGVVWMRANNNIEGIYAADDNDIYFATVDSAKNVGPEIKLDTDSVASLRPRIIWDGSNYVIIWEGNYRFFDSNGAIDYTHSLYFTKISNDGSVVMPTKALMTEMPSELNRTFVSIETSDNGYSIASTRASEIYFIQLDSSGNTVGSEKQITSSDGKLSLYHKLVRDNLGYGLFWKDRKDAEEGTDSEDNDEVYFTRLDREGNELTSEIRLTNVNSYVDSLSASGDGSSYAIVYYDSREGTDYYFNIIDTSGAKKFTSDIKINDIGRGNTYIDVAYANNQYYIGASYTERDRRGQDGPEMYIVVFDDQGNKVREDRLTYNPWWSATPSIIASDDKAGLVWTDARAQPATLECELGNNGRHEIYFVEVE